jgi:hypothetical protein
MIMCGIFFDDYMQVVLVSSTRKAPFSFPVTYRDTETIFYPPKEERSFLLTEGVWTTIYIVYPPHPPTPRMFTE